MFSICDHANIRAQQRGFSPGDIDIIINFGDEQFHHDREMYTITKASLKRMKKYYGDSSIAHQFFEKLRGAFVVLQGELLITVAHKTKHHKRNR